MRFESIRNSEHPMYERAMQLYKRSFPLHEQREAASQGAILQDPAYHFSLVYDDTEHVGLALYWETEHFIYVELLCILPEMRNKQ